MPQRVIGVAELERLVGQEVGVSDWLPLTQERINAFAEVTEARQWIHCDADRARVVRGRAPLAPPPHVVGRRSPVAPAPIPA